MFNQAPGFAFVAVFKDETGALVWQYQTAAQEPERALARGLETEREAGQALGLRLDRIALVEVQELGYYAIQNGRLSLGVTFHDNSGQ